MGSDSFRFLGVRQFFIFTVSKKYQNVCTVFNLKHGSIHKDTLNEALTSKLTVIWSNNNSL